MTTHTCAASAAALPAVDPDPRVGAAAVLSALAVADGGAIGDDAELLALRPLWLKARAALKEVNDAHTPVETAFFAQAPSFPEARFGPAARAAWKSIERDRKKVRKAVGLDKAEARQTRALNAELRVLCRIADTPARTIAGVAFKAEVSTAEEHNGVAGLTESVMADILAISVNDRADADLLALGSRWEVVQAEWQALWAATPPDGEADDADVAARSSALFDEIMAVPAQTVAGLAVKARLLMVAHDVQDFSLPGVVAKATAEYEAGCRYHDQRAAYGLAADILRLAAA